MTAKKTKLLLAYDIGTTSLKTCVYSLENKLKLEASSSEEYDLQISEGGAAEQDPQQWYDAMVSTTRKIFCNGDINAENVAGISFCSQMQGLVLVDESGKALRPAMSYLDGRAGAQRARAGSRLKRLPLPGLKVAGLPLFKLIRSIQITGIAPTSVKDPLWKYHWVRENEPEIFRKVYKYLDVKEYLIMQLTGRAVMTRDSAGATFMYDNRPGRGCWSRELCRLYGMDHCHLPEIIDSTDCAGELLPRAASELGLPANIPVFGGGGDASLIGIGAGAVNNRDIHIYMGTSGWVSAVTESRRLDLKHMIASITCAVPEKYHYFCEQETAGKCMDWVARHLALDEIGLYLKETRTADDQESVHESLFKMLSEVVSETEPGCGGLLFTPWLHGSRSPFEDPYARGMFFNIGLNSGKRKLIRAVVEGLGFNLRWMLESIESRLACNETIRFVGGGAQSETNAQILADILGRTIEVPKDPQNSGALGAAAVAAVGLGNTGGFNDIHSLIEIERVYHPDKKYSCVYERNYRVFKNLYNANRKFFTELNG